LYDSDPDPDLLATDQWTERKLTESAIIPIVDAAKVHINSIADTFDPVLDAQLPWSLNIPDFPPELNYHLEVVAKVSHTEAKVSTN